MSLELVLQYGEAVPIRAECWLMTSAPEKTRAMKVIREVLLEKIRSWVQGSKRDKGAHYEDPEAEDRSHLGG